MGVLRYVFPRRKSTKGDSCLNPGKLGLCEISMVNHIVKISGVSVCQWRLDGEGRLTKS